MFYSKEGTQQKAACVIPVRCVGPNNNPQLEFLVSERSGGPNKGKLTFPGGEGLADEASIVTAWREHVEETGQRISVLSLVAADPIRLIGGSRNTTISPYIAVVDEGYEPEVTEPAKHKGWIWVNVRHLTQAVIDNKLPTAVLTCDNWIDVAKAAAFEHRHGDEFFRQVPPAGFMYECESYRKLGAYEKFLKKVEKRT